MLPDGQGWLNVARMTIRDCPPLRRGVLEVSGRSASRQNFDGPTARRTKGRFESEGMKSRLVVAAAVTSWALFSVDRASAETWSCAVNEKIGGARIQQYRVEGKVLKELTSDKIMRKYMPDSKDFLGFEYNILLNNKKTF
jgi:hypothetical protein